MSAPREQFLQRIREAVAEGNRAGGSPPLPERGRIGYQGAGGDPLSCFRDRFAAAGGQTHLVADDAAAVAVILEVARARSVQRVLIGGGAVLSALHVAELLRQIGVAVADDAGRDALFQADLGISGVDYLIAETGSIVVASRPELPRSLSLLPPIHIAVAERRQILPDLFDLFEATRGELPACWSIITGPSKTGDIELKLVTGVHGPGEVHAIVIDRGIGVSE